MIDVRELIAKYTIAELNEQADQYYIAIDRNSLLQKPFRVPEVKHLLAEVSHLAYGLQLTPGDHVLDFGCGPGWTSNMLASCGCKVIAVDVSEAALSIARDQHENWRRAYPPTWEGGVEFRLYDGLKLPLETASVNKVFVLDAFHHVPDQAAVLREFARVLKPGGIAGFCEPGPNHSKHPDSQREMMTSKVIENDIVLSDIEKISRDCGFDSLTVSLNPLLPRLVDFKDYVAFPTDARVVEDFIFCADQRVKNYPIFFLHREGERQRDSRDMDQLNGRLECLTPDLARVKAGDSFAIRVRATNTGASVWLPSGVQIGSVSLGGAIVGDGLAEDFRRALSQAPVDPQQTVEAEISLIAPASPGRYRITIDLVSEYVCWFKTLNGAELELALEVV